MMMETAKQVDLDALDWKYVSRVIYDTMYIRTEKAELNNRVIYRHLKTRKDKYGMPTDNTKIVYSETLESRDLTPQQLINKMIKLVQENPPQADK